MSRILIVGGYGAFGARVAERLAREPGLEIIVAGRSAAAAAAKAAELARVSEAEVSHARLDAAAATHEEIRALAADVLINASGPFQEQDYGLARAAIAARCHYLDLADARAFVMGITALDAAARAANVCVVSGASSVPGLSSAVVQEFAGAFAPLEAIEIGISPGNSFDPGVATAASILGQAGKPHAQLIEERRATLYGWQRLSAHRFPQIGTRLMSPLDVPDLELLPAHYPTLRTARFSAGLEVALFHLGLYGLAWLVRVGLIRDLAPLAGPLLRVKRALRFLGSDRGGMYVRLRGRSPSGAPIELVWHLIARSGHGPYVPGMATVIVAKRLAAGAGPPPGARACFGLFSLADFKAETADLDMTCKLDVAYL